MLRGHMLDGHVLVLNRVFQAVQITSVRRALILFYKGHVRAVDSEYRTYDFENWMDIPVQPTDHYVATPHRKILIPHVIQLLAFDRLPRQEVKFSRGNIYLRDSNRCRRQSCRSIMSSRFRAAASRRGTTSSARVCRATCARETSSSTSATCG